VRAVSADHAHGTPAPHPTRVRFRVLGFAASLSLLT